MLNSQTITPQATSANGVSLSQATTGAMLINGGLAAGGVATFSAPSRVTLTSGANLSAITFTVTGTGQGGAGLVEQIAGPNVNTVTTLAKFKTVSAVQASATTGASTLTVGVIQTTDGAAIWLNRSAPYFDVTLAATVSAGASLTYSWQGTTSDIQSLTESGCTWRDITGFTGKTASFADRLPLPMIAIRLALTAWASGTITTEICQWGG